MQALGSSRISNTTYLAAGAILWTFILQVFGISLEFDIPSIGLIIPGSTGLGLVLWAYYPDQRAIEHYLLWCLSRRRKTQTIIASMAYSVMFVQPWESSSTVSLTIRKDLSKRHLRVLRGRELRNTIQELTQGFWIIALSIPSFYLLEPILSQIGFDWWIIAYIFVVLTIFPLVVKNEHLLDRVSNYAFSTWLLELFSNDLKNRKALTFRRQIAEDITRLTIEEIITSSIAMVERSDWDGFEQNISNVLGLVGTSIPDEVSIAYLNQYIDFLRWSYVEKANSQMIVELALENSSIQITDAIEEISKFEEFHASLHFPDVEWAHRVSSVLLKLCFQIKNSRFIEKLDYWLYEPLDRSILEKLDENIIHWLGVFPSLFKGSTLKEEPKGLGNLAKIDQFLIRLILSVEQELLNPLILQCLGRWNFDTNIFKEVIKHRVAKALLEEDFQWPIDKLMQVLKNCVRYSQLLDEDKFIDRLTGMKNYLTYREFLSYIEVLEKEYRRLSVRFPADTHFPQYLNLIAKFKSDFAKE